MRGRDGAKRNLRPVPKPISGLSQNQSQACPPGRILFWRLDWDIKPPKFFPPEAEKTSKILLKGKTKVFPYDVPTFSMSGLLPLSYEEYPEHPRGMFGACNQLVGLAALDYGCQMAKIFAPGGDKIPAKSSLS